MTFLIPEFPEFPTGPLIQQRFHSQLPSAQESSGMRRMLRPPLDPAGKPGTGVRCQFPAFPLLLSLPQPPNPGLAPVNPFISSAGSAVMLSKLIVR